MGWGRLFYFLFLFSVPPSILFTNFGVLIRGEGLIMPISYFFLQVPEGSEIMAFTTPFCGVDEQASILGEVGDMGVNSIPPYSISPKLVGS